MANLQLNIGPKDTLREAASKLATAYKKPEDRASQIGDTIFVLAMVGLTEYEFVVYPENFDHVWRVLRSEGIDCEWFMENNEYYVLTASWA